MADQTPVPLQAAIAAGEPILLTRFSLFGNQGVLAANDPVAQQFELAGSFTGIAIAPDSEIDRCIVRYRLPSVGKEGQLTQSVPLSVDRPLIRGLRGPITVLVDPSTAYTDTFRAEGANPATTVPYGTATNAFFAPVLELCLGLEAGALRNVPSKRSPLHIQFPIRNDAGGELLAAVRPILGRKKLCITLQATGPGAGVMSVRVAVVRGLVSGTNPGTPVMIERQIFPTPFNTTVALDPATGNTERFQTDLDECDNFLNIYVSRAGGDAFDAALIQIDAID